MEENAWNLCVWYNEQADTQTQTHTGRYAQADTHRQAHRQVDTLTDRVKDEWSEEIKRQRQGETYKQSADIEIEAYGDSARGRHGCEIKIDIGLQTNYKRESKAEREGRRERKRGGEDKWMKGGKELLWRKDHASEWSNFYSAFKAAAEECIEGYVKA